MANSLEAVWQSYRNAVLEMSGEETSPDDLALLELAERSFYAGAMAAISLAHHGAELMALHEETRRWKAEGVERWPVVG